MSPNHSHRPSSTVTTAGATPTQACAACKYQRRRCNPDCTLAPYFPADRQQQFLNAHHLFGVRKILKAVQNLDPKQQAQAMNSIMFHSDARAKDPVGGCYRIILEFERLIRLEIAELELTNRHLAVCRAQAQAQHQLSDLNDNSASNFVVDNEDNAVAQDMLCNSSVVQQQHQQQLYSYYYGKNMCNQEMEQQFLVGEDEGDSKSPNFFPSSAKVELKGEPNSRKDEQEHDLKDAASLFAISEEQNSIEQGQEPDLMSTASFFMLKEEPNAGDLVQEHDLKGAASLFTLTHFNTSAA